MPASKNPITHHRAQVGDVSLHYLQAGQPQPGRAPLVLLHGFPQHSHMWRRIMPALAEHYLVIAPDLRGVGGSSILPTGYDKRTLAADVYGLMTQLGHAEINLVGYDLGAGVAYAFAAAHPEAVRQLVFMEFALAGFGVWEQGITPGPDWHNGVNWHAALFTLPDVAESFMGGQERKFLSWIFWHLSCNPDAISQKDFELYARQLSKPGAFRAGINLYAAVWTDGAHNRENVQQGKLSMPVLGVGGACSGGPYIAQFLATVADDVRPLVLEGAGHWLVEEQPAALTRELLDFFAESHAAAPKTGEYAHSATGTL
ncbi:alpha/beta fold hydrolase [Hymenobacter lapidiphilus]|uniref:Alpha/beta hydrolase n=1 Tax=Hymenobacter lapidiphilus TaxID=2608003 RepID=A0A7Y7PRC6_9BACT|nr:alpha/beta hydrolase [Hymenobacter lapidiphilus]NVO32282.1 alpha/beta hydrolase [Hymenobacter lapidiphilus]